jgi:hypothetical protein
VGETVPDETGPCLNALGGDHFAPSRGPARGGGGRLVDDLTHE